MYPDVQYILEALFGGPMPQWLATIKTFGLFVAIAFLVASSVLVKELKRKERAGLLLPERKHLENGEVKLIYPHERAGNIVLYAMLSGIVGAKIFNAFETWQNFIKDPIGNLFSGGGLTFYGGLIVGGAVLILYCRKHKIDIRHFADAIAPALMLAYAIGRLGCHFSGDGDWGIFNSAYVTTSDGNLMLANADGYRQALSENRDFFVANYDSIAAIQHLDFQAPQGLPKWLVAYNYKHNVINEGVRLANCTGKYCSVLPVAVFPTAIYEVVASSGLFLLMWSLRKRFKKSLSLFALYLILNGLERFFIEQIRVNYKYDWGFIQPTQAEIISVFLIVLGGVILVLIRKEKGLALTVGNKTDHGS